VPYSNRTLAVRWLGVTVALSVAPPGPKPVASPVVADGPAIS
jgi:hypothetical protein